MAERLEQREIAVDLDRQMQVGQVGAVTDDTARHLRIAEVEQTRLPQRVDREDPGALALRDLERAQHPRVIGAGILTGEDDQLGVVDVVRVTEALPMPMLSARATLVDSWHMLEQSGRLFVPKARTNSW